MREIKFRGMRFSKECMIYGCLRISMGGYYIYPIGSRSAYEVKPDTIGQYTGLKDKNGKEIYEGDIVRFTTIESYVVNPDCDLFLQFSHSYAKTHIDIVEFHDGMFVAKDANYIIGYIGLESIEDLRDCLGIQDNEDCDVNGTVINESLLGIEIIGNIHDNPELIKEETNNDSRTTD